MLKYGALNLRPQSSSFLGVPYRTLNMNPKKELLWGPWISLRHDIKHYSGFLLVAFESSLLLSPTLSVSTTAANCQKGSSQVLVDNDI